MMMKLSIASFATAVFLSCLHVAATDGGAQGLGLDAAVRFHASAAGAFRILADAKERRRQRAHRNSGATATSTTASVHAAPSSSGGLRLLTEAEEKSCKDKLGKCQADLDTCGSKKTDDPSLLFVQMAQTCKLKEKSDGKGKTYYEFSSKDFDDDTYSFTDRPYRIAGTTPTKRFFKDFDTAFSEETGGKPNAVVTFRHEDTGNFEGPLITVFVEAAHRKDSGKYVYKLTQSEEQEKVHALKDFFRKGDGKDDGVVEYEMCSIFIDSTSGTCDPKNVDKCKNGDCVEDKYKKDQCKDCPCYYDNNRHPTFCEQREANGDTEPMCYVKRAVGEVCHEHWQCSSACCSPLGSCTHLLALGC